MANLPYNAALVLMATDGIGWESNNFLIVALGTTSAPPASGYTFNADHFTRTQVEAAADLVLGSAAVDYPDALAAGRLTADDVLSIIPPLGQRCTNLVVFIDNSDPDLDIPLFHWDENANGSAFSRVGDGTSMPVLWNPSTKMVKIGL